MVLSELLLHSYSAHITKSWVQKCVEFKGHPSICCSLKSYSPHSETNPDPNPPIKSCWPWSWLYRSGNIGKKKLNTHLLLLFHASTSPMGVVFFQLLVHDFLITGSKNGKTDALSQFYPSKHKSNTECTLKSTSSLPLVGPLIEKSQKDYVIIHCHISALQDIPWSLWHTRYRISHLPIYERPGVIKIHHHLNVKYWWESMLKDTFNHVLFVPKPTSQEHCLQATLTSHSSLLTVLHNYCIDFWLAICPGNDHHFGNNRKKSLRLTSLAALLTVFETTEALFQHVFRYFSIPEDIAPYSSIHNGQSRLRLPSSSFLYK